MTTPAESGCPIDRRDRRGAPSRPGRRSARRAALATSLAIGLAVACAPSLLELGAASARPPRFAPLVSRSGGPADLVLLYQGGVGRLAWTEEELSGYVTHKDPRTRRERWLFDGFLFLEFKDGRGARFVGQLRLRSATRADWTWLSDRLFQRGVAVDALDRAVAAASARIGRPARRRKVILGLPEPIHRQKDWGELDGRPLDFDRPGDRLAATEWYVRQTLRRWRERAPAHLDLQGFYWIAEDASDSRALLPRIADLVHAEGLELVWIPYWGSPRLRTWRELGFDRAYLQPNHFFKPTIPDRRLDEACETARSLGMGLEIEFDARAWSDPAYRHRLPAYFSRFRAAGALAAAPLAWYEAGGAIRRMAASTDPSVRRLYRQLAGVVIARQIAADRLARQGRARRR